MAGIVDLDDDFFTKLNTSEAYLIKDKHNMLIDTIREQTVQQLIQQFGIQELLEKLRLGDLNSYQEGGDFSTVHNAKKGVFVDRGEDGFSQKEQQFNKKYNHDDYIGKHTNHSLKKQSMDIRNSSEDLHDAYTGKIINKKTIKNGHAAYDMDHVTSAKSIHDNDKMRLFLTDQERDDMASSPENIAAIKANMNRSKGGENIFVWAKKKAANGHGMTNAERYGLDNKKLKELDKTSEKKLNGTLHKAERKEFNQAATHRGLQQAKRQAVGVIAFEFSDVFLNNIRIVLKNWSTYVTFSDKLQALKETVKDIKNQIIDRLHHVKEILSEVLSGVMQGLATGFIGSVVSAVINQIVTTVGKFQKVLFDALEAIITGIKKLVVNPENLEKKALVQSVLKDVALAISASLGVVFSSVIGVAIDETPLAPFSAELSSVLGGLLGAVIAALAIYSIDNFGQIVKTLKESWSTLKQGVTLNVTEIKSTYELALTRVDDTYKVILKEIEQHYEEIGQLAYLAHDIDQLASSQLHASIDYARVNGVSDSKILHNNTEITNFFKE